jgi:hypothetical protein
MGRLIACAYAEAAESSGNFVIRAKGSSYSPTAPNGCTMLVFFLKSTAALKKALLNHTGVHAIEHV